MATATDDALIDEAIAAGVVPEPGSWLEMAYAKRLGVVGDAKLPRPQSYPPDHRRYGEPHPQQIFHDSDADIVIFGGAAGGGKTFSLMLEAARDRDVPGSKFVYFRRQQTDINKAGGPWDVSMSFFPQFGAEPNLTAYKWRWPNGASGQFASLQYDKDVLNWQTAQIDCFLFDELTHFTESQFWYMLSRNRSMLRTKKRLRAGTNPDGASWVKKVIAPWVDEKWDGITYRLDGSTYKASVPAMGELRFIARDPESNVIWVDQDWRYPPEPNGQRPKPKSITFVPSLLDDNIALQENDPDYVSNLLMQDAVNSAQLLRGDWGVMRGAYFAEWTEAHAVIPTYAPGSLPKHWRFFGGLDWGYGSPFAFVLCATDERGRTRVLAELHERQLTTPEQSGKVCAVLNQWGVDKRQCLIAADPRMFSKAKRADLIGEADIEAFHRAGLQCVEANDNREHGWGRVRDWLQATDADGANMFEVWRGYCSHLIEQFPVMQYSTKKPNDMDTDGDDHLHDALRYALMTRPRPSGPPPAVESATSSIGQYLIGHKKRTGGYA